MSHILRNELYTGKVINGKQEVTDFLTGQRTDKSETDWIVVDKPGLRIIEDEAFQLAQEILQSRFDSFKMTRELPQCWSWSVFCWR